MEMKRMELKHNLSTVSQMWINDVLAEKSADLAEETWKKGRSHHNDACARLRHEKKRRVARIRVRRDGSGPVCGV